MRIRVPLLVGLALVSLAICATVSLSQPHATAPVNFPSGFDFPAAKESLLQLVTNNDLAGMRKHSWMVFAGMTQSVPTGEAIWETWYRSDETFNPGAAPQGVRVLRHRFRPPRQFMPKKATPLAVGNSLLSFVLLSPSAHKFIRTNQLYKSQTLDGLRTQGKTNIPDFPNDAMSLKAVWWPVKKDGFSALPVWDAQPTKPIVGSNDFPTWKRILAIDPNRTTIPAGETTSLRFYDVTAPTPEQASPVMINNVTVAPIQDLYCLKLTADDLANADSRQNLNRSFRELYRRDVTAGDYVALVALHCTTKEIPNWTWQTFWWHDKPDTGKFADGRPDQVTGVWRHYLMNISYDMVSPTEADGTPHVCYNPWLEARFQNGTMSNCMTCHQLAVWPTDGTFLPITRGPQSDSFFDQKTKLDFLWSLGFESK
jgi:hypothetical protein